MNRHGIGFVVALCAFLSLTGTAAAAEKLRLRSDYWCPFACEPGPRPGLIMEVLKEILGPQGYEFDYQLINFARAIEEARAGRTEGVVGAAVSDAPDFVFSKEAIAAVTYEVMTLKTKPWKYTGKLQKKIGVINSYTYDDTMNRLIEKKDPNIIVVSGNNAQDQAIQMLNAGRIDGFYESPQVFKENLLRLKMNPDLYQSAGGPPQAPQLLYMAISPKYPNAQKLAGQIEAGVKKMRQSGQFKKLLDKYGLKDWKKN